MHRRAATEATTDTDWKESATEAALSALQDILGTPGPKEVTAAVRAQLEQGNVVRTLTPCPRLRRQLCCQNHLREGARRVAVHACQAGGCDNVFPRARPSWSPVCSMS